MTPFSLAGDLQQAILAIAWDLPVRATYGLADGEIIEIAVQRWPKTARNGELGMNVQR
jgi:hypothetical protein